MNSSNTTFAVAIVDGVKVMPDSTATVFLPLPDSTTVEVYIEAGSVPEEVYVGIKNFKRVIMNIFLILLLLVNLESVFTNLVQQKNQPGRNSVSF